MPLIRMQPDMQNQGYALGVAAAMVAETDTLVRHVDIDALQQHLIEIGNLPDRVLTDEDSFPLSDDQIASAVAKLAAPRMWRPSSPARSGRCRCCVRAMRMRRISRGNCRTPTCWPFWATTPDCRR